MKFKYGEHVKAFSAFRDVSMKETLEFAINKINAPDIRNQLLKLNNRELYNDSLLFACAQCEFYIDYQEDPLFQFIELLVTHRKLLSLNLNTCDLATQIRPAYYAAFNMHPELYFLLVRAGADVSSRNIGGKTPMSFRKSLQFFKNNFDDQFFTGLDQLQSIWATFSKEIDQTKIADSRKIIFICKTLDHLLKYYKVLKVDNYQYMNFASSNLERAKKHLIELCLIIKTLSPSLQEKYNDRFQPLPFTWITFQQFSSFLKGRSFATSITGIPVADESECDVWSRLYKEVVDQEFIVNNSMSDIIKEDLPALRSFFHQIFEVEVLKKANSINKLTLLNIKTLTARMMDNEVFLKLVHLLDYSDNRPILYKSKVAESAVYLALYSLPNPGKECAIPLNLATKIGRFAAIRRLQLIGELITGKNFSCSLLSFDHTINWRAFVEIRDAIVHQDEDDNKHKIDSLMTASVLEQIMGCELPVLLQRLTKILVSREQTIYYDGNDHAQHWQNVRSLAIKQYEAKKLPVSVEKEVKRRASKEEETMVLKALLTKGASQDLIDQCKVFLDGTGDVPETKIIGEFKKFFPSRSENREEFARLSLIIKAAFKFGKKSEVERNMERLALQQQAAKKREEEQKKYIGLDSLRELAQQLNQKPQKKHCLTMKKRILAAREALHDAKECLLKSGYLVQDSTLMTMTEWDEFNIKKDQPGLFDLIINDNQLFYALGYCVAQSLQHLEKIREAIEEGKLDIVTQYMIPQREYLRETRNYIEHPILLLESLYLLETLPEHQYYFQRWFAPRVIDIIFNLENDLKLIEQIISSTQQCLIKKEAHKPTISLSAPGNNGLFKVSQETSDDDGKGKDKDKSYYDDDKKDNFSSTSGL